jgi:hypothetical protein
MTRALLVFTHGAAILLGVYGGFRFFDLVTK